MVIATRMRMSTVMGMPMTMCTGTYTIGKHAPWTGGERMRPGMTYFFCPEVNFGINFEIWSSCSLDLVRGRRSGRSNSW